MDRVTADSNIYISALRFGGKPLTLLELALEGEIELAISDDILAESLGVLEEKFERTSEELAEDRLYITACTKRVEPNERITAVPNDPDDDRILECAVAADSKVIVTGDKHLLSMESFRGIEIMKVEGFLQRFA